MFYSQQHQSSPVQSIDPNLCPPPLCTRVGSARQQALRMEALHTACPLDVMVSQDTRIVLWPQQDMLTLSTLPSTIASHHRFVHYWITQLKICKNSICANMCACILLQAKNADTPIHTHILHTHIIPGQASSPSCGLWNVPYGRLMIQTNMHSSVRDLGDVIAVTLKQTLLG